jgi:hypothetical protein
MRWLLYAAGLVGLVRVAEEGVAESGSPTEPIDPKTRAEWTDVHVFWVLIAGLGVLLFLWAVVVIIYPLFNYFQYERTGGRQPSKVLTYLPPLPPEPRNESSPLAHAADFFARQSQELSRYRWVDRTRGVVSIPIERAMQIVAQQGIPPSRPGGKEYSEPQAGSRLTGFEGKTEPLPR